MRDATDEASAAPAQPTERDAAYEAAAAADGVERGWLLAGVCAREREWPRNCAELKPLFEGGQQAYPLDAPGFVFVRAPMAGGGGCVVGVKCEDGRPSEVMYLIPGRYDIQPPAGLEGYTWREGEGGGFWMVRQDAFSGALLFDE